MSGQPFAQLRDVLRAMGSPALALALLLVPLALIPVVLITLRIALAVGYGGGVDAFDRRYEERIAERIGRAETPAEAFEQLAAHWQPQSSWQREVLHTDDSPEDLCSAEFDVIEDGRRMFAILCAGIEPFALIEAPPRGRRSLAADARGRALWLTARALRMSSAWLTDLPVIVVQQVQPIAAEDVVVYTTAFERVGRTHTLEALLAGLEEHTTVVEDSAQGRRRPITFR